MPTVIDQLVVTLDLDSSKFEQGIKRAMAYLGIFDKAVRQTSSDLGGFKQSVKLTNNTFTAFGDNAQIAAGGIRNVTKEARPASLGILALTAAVYKLNQAIGLPALRKMTQEVVDTETETIRFAQSLHLNTTELQAWQKTVQVHGGDVQGFNAGIEKMEANLGKLGTKVRGAKILQQYLGLAGITDEMVKTKDAFGVLTLFADQMQRMSVERQFLVGKRLGLDDATIRTLQEGGPAILAQVQAMRELAATQEELRNAREVAVAQAQANLQWERAKQVISAAFLPVLKSLAEKLSALSQWVRENKDLVVAFAKTAAIALAGLTAGVTALAVAWMAAAVASAFATGGLSVAAGAAALAAAGITGVATASLLAADGLNGVASAHAGMVEELYNGDAKYKHAAEMQARLAKWTKENSDGLHDLTRQLKEAHAALADFKSESFMTRIGMGGFTEGDLKRQAQLKEREAAVQKSLDYLNQRIAGADLSMAHGARGMWASNPVSAAAVSAGVQAGRERTTEIRINTVQVNTSDSQVNLTWDGKQIVQTPGGRVTPPQAGRAMR